MYLVDTNVWLERLLAQERADDVGRLLAETTSDRLFVTDFALHSIGVILARLDQLATFRDLVQDLFVDGGVTLVRLEPDDMNALVEVATHFSLDFDDAYQYLAATKHNLTLVSYDADFDRTEAGRKTPAQLP